MDQQQGSDGSLRAHRLRGGDVEVVGSGTTEGWTFRVSAGNRSLTVTPPNGQRIDYASWRAIPIAAVLKAAADEVTVEVRLDDVMKRVPKLRRLRPPEHRDQQIAVAYRQALLAGVAPRAVVARLLDVGEDRAGREITRLRNAGLIESVHEERRRIAEEAAR